MLRFTWKQTQVTVYALSAHRVLHEKNRTLEIDPSQLSASPSRLRVKGCGTQTSKPDVAGCYASPRMKRKVPSMRYSTPRAYTRKTAPLKSTLRSSVQALRGLG